MLIIVFWYSFFVLKVTGSLVTRFCPHTRSSAHWCFNWYPSNSSVCRFLRFSLVLISKLPPNLFLCRFRSLQMKLRRPLRTTHSTFVALQCDMNNFKSNVMLCPTLLEVTILRVCFSCFLNCTNGTKLRKVSPMFLSWLIRDVFRSLSNISDGAFYENS